MIEIEREDLETLLELAFENWEMAESEWSHCPAPEDLAFLLKMSLLSGDEELIQKAHDKIQGDIRHEESVVRDYTANLEFDLSRREDAVLDTKRIIKEAEERVAKLRAITSPKPPSADPSES